MPKILGYAGDMEI